MRSGSQRAHPDHLRLLVAEDELLIVDLIAEAVVGSRFEVAGRAGTVSRALALMDAARFDAAVLDANLAGELSQPVATRLEAAGVPYLLLTAYRPSHLPRGFIGVPVLAKPFAPDHLLVALNGLVSPAQPG